MGDLVVDQWETFDFSTPADAAAWVTALAANDNNAGGTWSIVGTTAALSTAVGSELAVEGTINTSLNDASGTYGFVYNCVTGTNVGATGKYLFASSHADLSFGFWFKFPAALVASYAEHDIFCVFNALGSRQIYIKLSDNDQERIRLHNGSGYSASLINVSPDTWYWITVKYDAGSNHLCRVYTTAGVQVDSEISVEGPASDPATYYQIGSLIGSDVEAQLGTLQFDDLLVDYDDATFPLGPGAGGGASIGGALNVHVRKAL